MVLNPCAESMITAGMELINFIDPTLTWKTVSKGRRTSRRSRRPVAKFLNSEKDQGKKNFKRSSGTDSDKSDLSVQEQGSGNMEHMPIKKRRLFLRSPSPTPQSPNHEDSQELDSGPCTLDPQICSNENTEQDVSEICFSKPVLSKCGIDGVVENITPSFSEVLVSSEDFSGVAILAAVATCSDEMNCTVDDIEKSKMSDLPKRKYNESFSSMTDMKDNIAMPGSSYCPGMTTGQLVVDGCVADFPSNSIQDDCLKNVTEISELSRVETNESVLSAINQKESIVCRGSSSDLTNKPIKTPDKAAKISGPKKSRLHWDLNILMEEWDHPIDDTFDDSCMESVAVASTSAMSFQNNENVDPSMLSSPERPLAIESGDHSNAQSVTCLMPNSKMLPDYGGLTSVITASKKSGSSLGKSSDLIRSSSQGNYSYLGTSITAIETTSNGAVELIQRNTSGTHTDPNSEYPLFLGMEGANNLVSTDTKFTKVAAEGLQSTLKTKVPENNLSLVALSENCACDVKGFHSGHSDSKERDDLDENRKGSDVICRPVSINTEPLKCRNSLDANENKSLDALSISTNSEVPMVGLRNSDDSHCLSTMEVFVAPLATIVNENAMNKVVAKELEENSSTPDASGFDNLMKVVPNVTEALMWVNPTINNANVANVEQGYDSYLEDGELRESVRHCWEDNEGDDAEIEQVDYDYDSDNEDIQLSGEVLSGDCEQQNYHFEKCGPSLDNSVDEKCSLQRQNCLLTVAAEMAENVKLESPMLKACYGTQLRVEHRVEGDSRDSERSDVETDRSGNEYVHNTSRNCRGASSRGREMQLSDRRASNFDDMRQADCSGESVTRRQAPPLKQTDRFVSRSGNAELKGIVPDSLPKKGDERIGRVSEDNTPTSVCAPRIISTSRSVYNPIRGSPGERNNGCGRGTVKEGNFTLDSNPWNKYDRSLNGINRGFDEGYKRPAMYEGGKANGPIVNHFENRIDSYFPQTHRKFGSRSRTRSPDFRVDTRIGRARSPYQPPGVNRARRSPVKSFSQRQRFDAMGSLDRLRSDDCTRPMMRPARFDNTSTSRDPDSDKNYHYRKAPFMHGNRRSRSRSRSYSPDSRMGAVPGPYQSRGGHVRERRSPMMVLQPAQKYDNGDHPTLRTGRFNGTSHPARGNDYNNGGDEYRRNPRNIFERIHLGRQYDEQDNLSGRNSRGNENYVRGGGRFGRGGGRGGAGGDRRQGEFRREERGNIRNNNNSGRMFYSGAKHFEGGIRDYTEHLLPHGVRP